MFPHECTPENAPLFLTWIKDREGIAIWHTVNLSNPDQSWSAPVVDKEGKRLVRPHSYAEATPRRIITGTDEVLVTTYREVKRFHVGVEPHGMTLKLTGGATRRVHAAVSKAEEGACYRFDYETQDAVIMVPDKQISLTDWVANGN